MWIIRKIVQNRLSFLLWGILALGLLLRMQQWGKFIVADEDTLFGWIRQMPGNPFPIHFYPPFFQYINYYCALIYGPLLSFLGIISHSGELWVSETGRTIVMGFGRLLSTFFGLLQIYWIFKVGKRFFSPYVGLLAAVIAAVNPLLILDSHILKVDLLLAFLFTMQLYYILQYWESRDKKTLAILGIVTGLAVAAKFQAAVEIPALIILIGLVKWREGLWAVAQTLLFLAGLIILGFFVGAPNWAVHLIGNIEESFRYVAEVFFNFELYDTASVSFILYIKDFFASFGPMVMIGVLGSLITLFLNFKWLNLLTWLTLASFIGILGFSGFYAHRMGLPLYAALSLLAAKFFLEDVWGVFSNRFSGKGLKWGMRTIFILAISLYVITQVSFSVKRFNLWQTASTLDRAIEFRNAHFTKDTVFVRENFSPIRPGDTGIWDLIGVEAKVFRGPDAMPFASTGLLAEYLLHGFGDKQKQNELRHRLQQYLPLQKIRKVRFSPWDDDVTFWYHTSLAQMNDTPSSKRIHLPKVFSLHRLKDTLAYPPGVYEKEPGLLRTAVMADIRMIYSLEEISGFKGIVFPDEAVQRMVIDVNGRSVVLSDFAGPKSFQVNEINSLSLHHDWVYRITADAGSVSVWVVFEPIYKDPVKNVFDSFALFKNLPDIETNLKQPDYSPEEISLYKRTGLDGRLFTLLQRVYFNAGDEKNVLFLRRGVYRLKWEPLASIALSSPEFKLDALIITEKEQLKKEWHVRFDSTTVLLEIDADMAMCFWQFGQLSTNSKKIWLEPHLAETLNRDYGLNR